MIALPRRRGQPLIVLALVMTSWIGFRALAWNGNGHGMARSGPIGEPQALAIGPATRSGSIGDQHMTLWPDADAAPVADSMRAGQPRPGLLAAMWRGMPRLEATSLRAWRGYQAPHAAGWQLLPGLAAARTDARSPGGNVAPFAVAPAAAADRPKRWSVDAWLLARPGIGPTLAGGPAPVSYGASQAGAVVRYAVAPSSRFNPTIYARVNSALASTGDAELALGLSARPLRRIPVIALGEVRANRGTGRLRLRPAAMLVTQLPPFALPIGMTGEAYAQGGYVGGSGATPFVDGQVTVNHPLARVLGQRVGVGAGAWGGGQKGAARLDVGPSARVTLKLNHRISARFTLDYRLRVAGNAGPGSGPALTASTGF